MPAASWPRCCSACRPSATKLEAVSAPQIPKMPHSSRSLSSSNGLVVSMIFVRIPKGLRGYSHAPAICRLSPVSKLQHSGKMRYAIPLAILLAACSKQPAEPSLTAGTFAGDGRDRLCVAGEPGKYRAGLIAYGEGNVNCSASGRLEKLEGGWALVPRGEGDCRIPLAIDGNMVRIGQVPAACSYYCGPGAEISGKSYHR